MGTEKFYPLNGNITVNMKSQKRTRNTMWMQRDFLKGLNFSWQNFFITFVGSLKGCADFTVMFLSWLNQQDQIRVSPDIRLKPHGIFLRPGVAKSFWGKNFSSLFRFKALSTR